MSVGPPLSPQNATHANAATTLAQKSSSGQSSRTVPLCKMVTFTIKIFSFTESLTQPHDLNNKFVKAKQQAEVPYV